MADSPQPGGWIKLWRSFVYNGHLKMPKQALAVFIYLLAQVNRQPKARCAAGEGWITYPMIREACCEDDKPPWTDATITKALDYLEVHRYIRRIKTKNGAPQRLRVINYGMYQDESTSLKEVVGEVVQEVVGEAARIVKQEGKEGEEDTLPPPSAEAPQETAKRRQRQPPKEKAPKVEKAPDPYNVAAQPLVQRLDAWLKAHDTAGVGEWPAAVKMVANALKGKGGPPIPAEEAEQALIWGAKDARYRQRLLAIGALALREVWAAWKNGGAPTYGNNRYQDHTKIEPTGKSLFEN